MQLGPQQVAPRWRTRTRIMPVEWPNAVCFGRQSRTSVYGVNQNGMKRTCPLSRLETNRRDMQ